MIAVKLLLDWTKSRVLGFASEPMPQWTSVGPVFAATARAVITCGMRPLSVGVAAGAYGVARARRACQRAALLPFLLPSRSDRFGRNLQGPDGGDRHRSLCASETTGVPTL